MSKLEYQFDEKSNQIFSPLKSKWLAYTPEEQIRQQFVCTLVNDYGYSLGQMAQELSLTNSSRGTGRARADIVIWKSEQAKNDNEHAAIVVECKSDNVTIQPEDYYQGLNYATWAGADFFVTHNNKETRYFQVFKDKLPKHLGKELSDLPKAKQLGNQQSIEKILNEEKVFERDEFAKLLHQCHNIIRNNDKLSPEAAFDEISKILFTKIVFERDNRNNKTKIFSKTEFENQEKTYDDNVRPYLQGDDKKTDYVQIIFRQTKEKYSKDALFAEDDVIKIRRESFLAIVEKLQVYNLSKTSDDVKGIAFEKFLGTTFRGELGQFFTPRTIVEFMTEILDPQEGERVCDPCCGSGGFLINAFEYIRESIKQSIENEKENIKIQHFNEQYENASDSEKERIEKQVDDLFTQLNNELNLDNTDSRIFQLSHNCIYGTDANPRMARVSKMNMIMHGDGHGGVHHNDGLLDINGIFEERFDVILTNPPFGSRVAKDLKLTIEDSLKNKPYYKNWREKYLVKLNTIDEEKLILVKENDEYFKKQIKQGESIDFSKGFPIYSYLAIKREQEIKEKKAIVDKYDISKYSTLTEVMFIERCLKLLRKGGRMGIVLPEGVLNNGELQKVRQYFESKAKIILITSIPQDVFIASGATVKPSLVFLKRFTESEEQAYNQAKDNATAEITQKYANQKAKLQAIVDKKLDKLPPKATLEQKAEQKEQQVQLKEEKKQAKEQLKQLEIQIQDEIRQLIKEKFDYPIPLAEVEKAGIDSKGVAIENDLPALKDEFTQYRKSANIWENHTACHYKYTENNGRLDRTLYEVQQGVE
ncbi:N-6 DNA methylase [Moraxella sp. VT-16-12]|uniref:N-6 DNA methylase n=1 Tax=Moraxella sp. VT-16-12 TaxID=2014877 RepID=UPI000B7DD0D1|nr:N-6 DNA methylase [Moraxella sp. VT-16-12]TWV83103.1 N-6 DNA methylase [Moraxella sp. VT-16-12]